MMNCYKRRLMVPILALFALSWFYSYVNGAEAEIWELQLAGDMKGKLKMTLKQTKIEEEGYAIAGEFSGRVQDYEAGRGRLKCKLKGKIEKGVFVADFTGYADLAVNVPVHGDVKGTISESQGAGTWGLTHSQGSRTGEWTMKRIKPSQ